MTQKDVSNCQWLSFWLCFCDDALFVGFECVIVRVVPVYRQFTCIWQSLPYLETEYSSWAIVSVSSPRSCWQFDSCRLSAVVFGALSNPPRLVDCPVSQSTLYQRTLMLSNDRETWNCISTTDDKPGQVYVKCTLTSCCQIVINQ